MHMFFVANKTQVEAERTEVLRLAAELNDLRAASEQNAVAAREREAALKALLASETEVRSCATTYFEGEKVHSPLFFSRNVSRSNKLLRHEPVTTESQTVLYRIKCVTHERISPWRRANQVATKTRQK